MSKTYRAEKQLGLDLVVKELRRRYWMNQLPVLHFHPQSDQCREYERHQGLLVPIR